MVTPVHAVAALRWNYTWAGVRLWLRSPNVVLPLARPVLRGRGWWLVLRHPRAVVQMQDALATGAYL